MIVKFRRSQVWAGDPDGIPEPMVRADKVVDFGAVVPDVAVTSVSVITPVFARRGRYGGQQQIHDLTVLDPSPVHDVAVVSISAPGKVKKGKIANISVEVANEGNLDETIDVEPLRAWRGGTVKTARRGCSGPQGGVE